MTYRILGLSPEPFRHLFGLSDEALAAHGARRCIADRKPGFPDRIEVRDAEPGESLILVNYLHQPADSPFRASHAIFVSERAEARFESVGELPETFRVRMLSLRAFDEQGYMVGAELAEGDAVEGAVEQLLAMPEAAYIHAHSAGAGCYVARIERA